MESEIAWFTKTCYGTTFIIASSLIAWFSYQALFDPSARYPGPFLARFSQVHNFIHALQKDVHLDILKQHQIHGNVIRYGPKRVCFWTAGANLDIYGSGKLRKSDAYKPHPYYPDDIITFTAIDKHKATRLRRLIGSCFAENTLQSLDEDLVKLTATFCHIVLGAGEACIPSGSWSCGTDIGQLSFYFAMDLVMQSIYSKNLDLMRCHQHRWLTGALLDGNHYMYLCFAWPGLLMSRFSRRISLRDILYPRMAWQAKEFDLVVENLIRDVQACPRAKGFYAAVSCAKDPQTGRRYPEEEIWRELKMLTRAGADTASVAVAATLHYLSGDEESRSAVATELRSTFNNLDDILPGDKLNSCSKLIAAIMESQRLAPSTPGAFYRQLETDAVIDGHFIPRGHEVGVCQYAINHNPEYYPQPFEFRLERFLSTKPYAITPGAFAPFQLGPRTCPARPFAERQIRTLLARLIWLADFRPIVHAQRQRPNHSINTLDYPLEDMFTADKKGPVLQFQLRKGMVR